MGVVGHRGVRVDGVDLVIGHHFPGEGKERLAVRRVEAGRPMQAAAVMKSRRRVRSRCGTIQPLRMMPNDVIVRHYVPDGYIRDHAYPVGVGLLDGLLEKVPPAQVGMLGPEPVRKGGPFAGAAEIDRIGAVLPHDLDQLPGVEVDLRPERRVVFLYLKDARPPGPFVVALHAVSSPPNQWMTCQTVRMGEPAS